MRMKMRQFPRAVVTYMARNRAQNRFCCSGLRGRPKRRTL